MTKAQNTHQTDLLNAADGFNETIEKLTALSAMVTEIVGDDYDEHRRSMVRLGVSKMFQDILDEMQDVSDALWQAKRLESAHLRTVGANG